MSTDKSAAAIREFAEKWGFSQDKTNEGFLIDNDRTKQCLSDLTALIEEHYYPKEFTGWFRSGEFYNIFEEYTDDIGITSWEYLPSGQVLYGLDELFNYWKENER